MTTPLLLILAILLLLPAAIVLIVYAVKAFAFIVRSAVPLRHATSQIV